jgi:hypothetical protein
MTAQELGDLTQQTGLYAIPVNDWPSLRIAGHLAFGYH